MAGHQRTADTPAGGGRADGRTPRRAADRRALYYEWAYMLTLWEKGGYGGSPNAEAGKMYQQYFPSALPQQLCPASYLCT